MKKRRLLTLIFFFSIVLLRGNNAPIQAAERHSQNIIIVKPGLHRRLKDFLLNKALIPV